MSRIFISYKRVDKDKVFKIKDQIESALGEKCWIDLDGIESDAQFASVIIDAIDNAEVVLFMHSKAHTLITDFENDWTVRELNYAKEEKKRIVFVNIDNTPLTKWFKFMFPQKQQIDGTSKGSVTRLCYDLQNWLKVLKDYRKENVNTKNNKEIQQNGIDPIKLVLLGKKKYDEELYADALDLFIKAAKYDNADAYFYLGEIFLGAQGVERDAKKAYEFYVKAATLGHVEAMFKCYNYPIHWKHPTDYKTAIYWLERALSHGHKSAAFWLGHIYCGDAGKEQYSLDYEKAKSYYLKAKMLDPNDSYADECIKKINKKILAEAEAKRKAIEEEKHRKAEWDKLTLEQKRVELKRKLFGLK